jgi:hypothetical protein
VAAWVGTDYVAFCDDDTWWEPGSPARAVQLLDAWPNVGVPSARVVVGEDKVTDPTCAVMLASPPGSDGLPGPALIGYMAGACVFRTALFRAVGGYEPRLFMGGEEERVALDALAANRSVVYCEQLTVHHPSPAHDSGLRRRTLARNAAWIAWLRLPWPQACRATFALWIYWRAKAAPARQRRAAARAHVGMATPSRRAGRGIESARTGTCRRPIGRHRDGDAQRETGGGREQSANLISCARALTRQLPDFDNQLFRRHRLRQMRLKAGLLRARAVFSFRIAGQRDRRHGQGSQYRAFVF